MTGRLLRFRIWLAGKILPAGWGPCVTGKAKPPSEGYFDIYGDWHGRLSVAREKEDT